MFEIILIKKRPRRIIDMMYKRANSKTEVYGDINVLTMFVCLVGLVS